MVVTFYYQQKSIDILAPDKLVNKKTYIMDCTELNSETNIEEDDGEFYFESDHLALKGNKDYTALLKTIVILEAQRSKALEDLDKLLLHRKKAINDPISFVALLQNGDLPKFPGPQKIAEIPCIDWTKYNINLPDVRHRPQTRHGNVVPQIQPKSELENGKILVRGRPFDESKPETFNQLWTEEEQVRLEELLIEFPPEEVEMRRYTKIANALGNRTPKQVSSRCQKYFLKLSKKGLPIPGREPKVKSDLKRSSTHRHQKNYLLQKKSTFFPHQDLHFSSGEENKEQSNQEDIDETLGNGNVEDDPELRQLELYRQIKSEKEDDQSMRHQHFGYKCFVCGEEPLKGIRRHCIECQDGIDLCADCVIAQMEAENPTHNPSHKLIAIRPPKYVRSYDLDYLPQAFNSSSYNYLDPNFLPE